MKRPFNIQQQIVCFSTCLIVCVSGVSVSCMTIPKSFPSFTVSMLSLPYHSFRIACYSLLLLLYHILIVLNSIRLTPPKKKKYYITMFLRLTTIMIIFLFFQSEWFGVLCKYPHIAIFPADQNITGGNTDPCGTPFVTFYNPIFRLLTFLRVCVLFLRLSSNFSSILYFFHVLISTKIFHVKL